MRTPTSLISTITVSFLICLNCTFSTLASSQGSEVFPFLHYGKWGFLDQSGKVVIPAQYQGFGEQSEGFIAVFNGKKWGFINSKGDMVLDFKFDNPRSISSNNPRFSDGLACVQISHGDGENRYGYIDKSGKFIIKPTYKHGFNFSEGLASVLIGLKYGYIDKSGSVSIAAQTYILGSSFSDGLATIAIGDKWGFIDTTGKIAIRPQFDWAGDFSEGRASIKISGKFGFIDKTGQIVVRPIYDKVGKFRGGLAPVAVSKTPIAVGETFVNGTWGYVDQHGKVVIPLRYFEADNFSEGVACVNLGERTIPASITSGFIDRTGKLIIGPQSTTCTEFERGIAEVGIPGGNAFVDKSGKLIWRATYKEMHGPKN
jgi:hypothetical protein